MALAFDAQSSKTDLTQPSSITNAHTVTGSNPYLFVHFGLTAGTIGNVTACTYNGVSMGTGLWNIQPTGHGLRGIAFGLKGPATGAHNIVGTITGANDGVTVTAVSYTGVDQTTPIGTAVTNNSGAGTSATATVTVSSAAAELILGGIIIGNAATSITIGGGQTQRSAANLIVSNGEHDNRIDEEAGAASVIHSWSWTGATDWVLGAFALKPVASTTTAPPPYQKTRMMGWRRSFRWQPAKRGGLLVPDRTLILPPRLKRAA